MLDLSVLKNLWTEAGAREVFAKLVTHCVRSNYPDAVTVRPNPGDDGIDVINGPLSGKSHIWQCKYFTDGIDDSQKAQIRSSWKACVESSNISNMTKWTLCIPGELSVAELKWWDNWKAKCMKEHPNVTIQLWTHTQFEQFYSSPTLSPIFDLALRRSDQLTTLPQVLHELGRELFPIEPMPDNGVLLESIFVKKLEAAGIKNHRAARVAFYNFELIRELIEHGGTPQEKAQLRDLQERVYAFWEEEYNLTKDEDLGRAFFNMVNQKIQTLAQSKLSTNLGLQTIHKQGILHYWADLCQAGWTQDFNSIFGGKNVT